ncbi:type VII secretion target [Mycolicibacterium sp.]|uniref:type VII secretion target n=1 Tax=Mycolicibacterium sp. TaxID=2320850 RepID=UPI0037CAE334
MGHVDAARIDVAALLQLAGEYDAVADMVDAAARARLNGTVFDGASAGRAHIHHGDAVRLAVDDLTDVLREWTRSAREIATAVRTSADRYVVADAHASNRVG